MWHAGNPPSNSHDLIITCTVNIFLSSVVFAHPHYRQKLSIATFAC